MFLITMRNSHFPPLRRGLGALSLSLALFGVCTPAHSATDHEDISFWEVSGHTTTLMGFSREAAESVTWSGWILPWYLADQRSYRTDADRNTLVMGMRPHFSSLLMGDLKTTAQVNAAWARIASGTFAGLMDARERGDVAAAHNVLGTSLRAMQEFYVRSNWLSDASRKNVTYFEMPRARRSTAPIWTGAATTRVAEPQSPLGYSTGDGPNLPPLPNPQAQPTKEVSLMMVRHGLQWLQILERAMKKAGAADFWNRVKTTGVDSAQRQLQFQSGSRVPYTFLTEPTGSPAGDWWLRLQLQTGTETGSGTDGDIRARVGDKWFLLDWKHDAAPAQTYNDFEAGKDDAYFIGPFDTLPSELHLFNDSPGLVAGGLTAPLTVLGMLHDGMQSISAGITALTGYDDDYVKTADKAFTPDELNDPNVAQRDFSIYLDGKDEGVYRVHGKITRTHRGEVNTWNVQLNELECVRESKADQLSDSDEPYILLNIQPLPGQPISWRNEPFKNVDTGEKMAIGYRSPDFPVHASEGMLHIAVCIMEQDGSDRRDERDEILQRFAGKLKEKVPHSSADWGLRQSAGLSGNWKLDRMTVTAWNRSGKLRQGQMFNAPVGKWVGAGKTEIFPLSTAGVRETAVTVDDLLPDWNDFKKQPEPSTPPTTPVPDTPAGNSPNFDISQWQGEWITTMGRVNLTLEDGALRGRLMQKDDLGREREAERLELRADGARRKLAGTASYTGFTSQVTLILSGDGNAFTGTVLLRGETKPRPWSGKRVLSNQTTPDVPATTTAPTVPVVTPPVVPPVVTPPITTPPLPTPPVTPPATVPTPPASPSGSPVGDGKFYPLGKFELRVDKVEAAADKNVHAFVTLKNLTGAEEMIFGHTVYAYVEDADGVTYRSIKIARASTPEPQDFANDPRLAPGAELKARLIVPVLKGGAPLRSLTFDEDGTTATFDISGVSVPSQLAQPFASASGATTEWKELGIFDVRFDGARPQRGSAFSEMFFTFRNPSEKAQQIFFAGGTFRISMADADGSMQRDQGNLYSVRGLSPDSMSWQPYVMPGHEIRLRFLFRGPIAPTLTIEHTPSGTKQTYATR
jgi:hypothetical protein